MSEKIAPRIESPSDTSCVTIDGVLREVGYINTPGLGDVIQNPPVGHLPEGTHFQINGGEIYTAGQEIGFLTQKGERRLVRVWGRARGIGRLLINSHARVEEVDEEFEMMETPKRGFTVSADAMRLAAAKQNAIVRQIVEDILIAPDVLPQTDLELPQPVQAVTRMRQIGEWEIDLARGDERKTVGVKQGELLEIQREADNGAGGVGMCSLRVRVSAPTPDGSVYCETIAYRGVGEDGFDTSIPKNFSHPIIKPNELWDMLPAIQRSILEVTRQKVSAVLDFFQSGFRRRIRGNAETPSEVPAGLQHFGQFHHPPAGE